MSLKQTFFLLTLLAFPAIALKAAAEKPIVLHFGDQKTLSNGNCKIALYKEVNLISQGNPLNLLVRIDNLSGINLPINVAIHFDSLISKNDKDFKCKFHKRSTTASAHLENRNVYNERDYFPANTSLLYAGYYQAAYYRHVEDYLVNTYRTAPVYALLPEGRYQYFFHVQTISAENEVRYDRFQIDFRVGPASKKSNIDLLVAFLNTLTRNRLTPTISPGESLVTSGDSKIIHGLISSEDSSRIYTFYNANPQWRPHVMIAVNILTSCRYIQEVRAYYRSLPKPFEPLRGQFIREEQKTDPKTFLSIFYVLPQFLTQTDPVRQELDQGQWVASLNQEDFFITDKLPKFDQK